MKRNLKPIYALWLLITIAMVIFLGISFSKDITLWGHTFTKARFPETLLAAKEEEPTLPETPPDTVPEIREAEPVPPDTTVHNVLVFGDSMTHNLAMSISKYGTKNHYKVTGVTWESSSIPGWSHSGKIKEYMEMSKPDYVIISLGSNEMELKNFERRLPDVDSVIKQVGDVPYVWVGPPLWKEDRGLYAMLEKRVPKGKLFRTEGIEIERGGDHIHPTRKGADTWADTLMRWIRTTEHPILTERPDSGTSTRGHKFVYLHPND